jgi:hypothetical protein
MGWKFVPRVAMWEVVKSLRSGVQRQVLSFGGHCLQKRMLVSWNEFYESLSLTPESLSLASCLAMRSRPPAHTSTTVMSSAMRPLPELSTSGTTLLDLRAVS